MTVSAAALAQAATAAAAVAPEPETGAESDVPAGAVRGTGAAECPEEYPIKGNQDSMIYHERDDRSYPATDPEICFATVADARAAGYQRPANH